MRNLMAAVAFCVITLGACPVLGAVEPSASDQGPSAEQLAADIAAKAIFDRSRGLQGPGADFLRRIAMELGGKRIGLSEAQSLLAIGEQLGLLGASPAAATTGKASADTSVGTASTATVGPSLSALLDGKPPVTSTPQKVEPTAETVQSAAPVPDLRLVNEPKPLSWQSTNGKGSVAMVTMGNENRDTFLMAKHLSGKEFEIGQHFLVQRAGKDIARGMIVDMKKKNMIGSVKATKWLVDEPERLIEEGDTVIIQQRE